jgi:hypothetical protein
VILDKETINAKRDALSSIASTLKSEFFGLDTIIDQVMRSIEAWYICPQIITRPVIVNLWGMTGVGKTALVRRLSSLLGFSDRFVEVVMDGGSQHGYWSSTLSSILRDSKVEEGEPGILLLDEMQRFRTVDAMGGDVEVERYADTWTLLSDGKFSANSSAIAEIEMMFAQQLYDVEEPETVDELINGKDPEKKEHKVSPWQARNLKKTLRLTESITKIMTWKKEDIQEALRSMDGRESWEYDFTKLVIFVSGNLDQAFVGATATGDSDTDADFYHELTKSVSLSQIKKALTAQFKPEQVARFGSNHIIYPSMSKASYEALIAATCKRYTDEMEKLSGKKFNVTQELLGAIYDNSVFPTQGTRPVFSAIHMMFSSLLMDVAFWMIENDLNEVSLDMLHDAVVIAKANGHEHTFHVDMRLTEQRAQITRDFRTMVAVHEAGHAVVYAIRKHVAPFEVKVNLASFQGGYMASAVPSPYKIDTKNSIFNDVVVLLAGRAAEEMVFGEDNASNGAESDISEATTRASAYIRRWGFGDVLGRIESGGADRITWITKIAATDDALIAFLHKAYHAAKEVLDEHRGYFSQVVTELIQKGTLKQDEFIALSKPFVALGTEEKVNEHCAQWEEFEKNVV